ncbi:MAG: ATPase, partial [Rhodobiaceae bacterium]|nr:ATPase [Rhodobiaceae bacterium]
MPDPTWGDIDPIRAAAKASAPERPKRFYKEVGLAEAEGGVVLVLDGRPARTPGRRPLVMPAGAFAEAAAEEWRAQGETINPATMPVTRAANTVIDGVVDQMEAVRDEILKYAGTDLLCYRADNPEALCALQTQNWDPVVDWVAQTYGHRPVLAGGVMHTPQPDALIAAIRDADFAEMEPFALAGLYTVTVLTGSAFLALALKRGLIDADAVWTAAHVDEDW